MTQNVHADLRTNPVFGRASIVVGLVLSMCSMAAPTVEISRDYGASPGGGSIGAVTGGIGSGTALLLVLLLVTGLLLAAVGVTRGERPRWLHGAGVLLNLAAPFLAVAVTTMRA